MSRLLVAIQWFIAFALVIQCSGCADFLSDYTYTPVGSSQMSSNY